MSESRPAALWAQGVNWSRGDVDCVTAVMLKILDGKCKMQADQQHALAAIYEVTCGREGELFGERVHEHIATARGGEQPGANAARIHAWRLEAEATIPKPVMKAFKAMLREALEGQ